MSAKHETAQHGDTPDNAAASAAASQNEAGQPPEGNAGENVQAAHGQDAAATPSAVDDGGSDLEAEVRDLQDRLKRAVAETENVRRRADRERQETAKYAAAPLAKDLLGVADNLRRAIDSVPANQIEGQVEGQVEGNEALKSLLSGVEMTEKELLGALEKHNVAKMAVQLGDRFDPHRHEAMFEVPTDQQAPGTVAHVLQPGYILHDRLLRPARVGVAKAANGGPGQSGQSLDTNA